VAKVGRRTGLEPRRCLHHAGPNPAYRIIYETKRLWSACAAGAACASDYLNCRVSARFGEPFGNTMLAVGEFKCDHDTPHFQLEICIQVFNPKRLRLETKVCNHEGSKNGQIYADTDTHQDYVTQECGDGYFYYAWVWGFAWGTGWGVSAKGKLSEGVKCEGRQTVIEIAEWIQAID
jgi:hypothetical protein